MDRLDRPKLEDNVKRELEALLQRLPLLEDMQLSGLITLLRAVVPREGTTALM
jgi:hypothetical protein